MSKQDIEKIIKEEFKKLGKRKGKKVSVTTDNVTDSYYVNYESKYISVNIDLLLDKAQMNWSYVWVDENYRGKGLGRKIVDIGERIAERCGIREGYILSNSNQSFWDYMGYLGDCKKFNTWRKK